MSFAPFPILDFGGLSLEKESWISPQNAWQLLNNGHSYRGQLRKREGRKFTQKLGISTTEIMTFSAPGVYTHTLTEAEFLQPLDPFGTYNGTDYTIKMNATGASGAMELYVAEVPAQVVSGVYKRNIRDSADDSDTGEDLLVDPDKVHATHGDLIAIFPEPVSAGNATVTYEYSPELPVMGFGTLVASDGSEHHVAFNTKRMWLMNNAEQRYYEEEAGLGDIWTGTNTDHFWLWQFGDILTINNGVDVPYKYDPTLGTTIETMDTDFAGGGDAIQAARMFVNYQNYGVYLSTKEAGQFNEGRVRWTSVGNAETFNDASDFLDAPSNDVIRSCDMVGADLFVGMRDRGWWHLELRDDAFAPFAWAPMESEQGAIAKNGTIQFRDRLMSRNRYGIGEINRLGQVNATPDLGDKAFTWSASNAFQTQAFRYDARRQAWWSYADGEDDTPQHALVMQFNPDGSRSISTYDIPLHSYGLFRPGGAPVWDDVSDPWDEIGYSWDSPQNQGGFTQLVGGDLTGNIHTWDQRLADQVTPPTDSEAAGNSGQYQDEPIDFLARSIRLSPFPNQKVWLGWIDIIVAPSSVGSLEISVFADYESAPYKTTIASLDRGSSSSDKLLRRFEFNRIATFHTIQIRERTTGGLEIDYIAPWFKPAGRVREID